MDEGESEALTADLAQRSDRRAGSRDVSRERRAVGAEVAWPDVRIDLVGDGVAGVAHRTRQLVHVERARLQRQRGGLLHD